MKILVTGGAGYIGSVLTEVLFQQSFNKNRVRVLDNLMYGDGNLKHLCHEKSFNFIQGDVRNTATLKNAMKDADVIIPLAAIVGAGACDKHPELAREINIDQISFICKNKSRDQRLIYPNTNSGYGTKSGEEYCTEETPLEPITHYGRTKVAAERFVLDTENAISFRLATVFGVSPRMRIDLLVNNFVYKAMTDNSLLIYEKHFKRNFVHIRDVASCFEACTYCIMPHNLYNLGNDEENLTKEELANKVKKYIPSLYISYDGSQEDPDKRNYIVSSKRLRDDLLPVPYRTIDEGIEELMKCYRMFGRSKYRNV